jgi:hypothetical protein
MGPKLLIFIALTFFISGKNSGDAILLFCAFYSLALGISVWLHRQDVKRAARKSPSPKA